MPQFKYRIDERLRALPYAQYQDTIHQLCRALGVSRRQFDRIRFCPVGGGPSHSFASYEQLKTVADVLGVSVTELDNQPATT